VGKVAVRHRRGLTTFYRPGCGGRRLVERREVLASEVLFSCQRLLEMGRGNEGGANLVGEQERIQQCFGSLTPRCTGDRIAARGHDGGGGADEGVGLGCARP
jgi:hypothetical protein